MDKIFCSACHTGEEKEKKAEAAGDGNQDINHIDCKSYGPYAIAGTFHLRITKGMLSDQEKDFVQHYMAAYIRDKKPEIVKSPAHDPEASSYYHERKQVLAPQ